MKRSFFAFALVASFLVPLATAQPARADKDDKKGGKTKPAPTPKPKPGPRDDGDGD